jgi:4-amino-4-deoxy-L-arabinose transferase-like glycosyltransferase
MYRVAVGLLLAIALLLRIGYLEATPDYDLVHDAWGYDYHARSIATGIGYGLSHERPTAFRPPGYPFFLAGVYDLFGVAESPRPERLPVARYAQAVIGTVIVALIGLLARQLWDRRVALVALGLGAVYVPLILIGGALMSEPLFVALMLGALAAVVHCRRSRHRWRWLLLTGVLAGLASLTRANGLILLLPLAFAVWDLRPRWSLRALAPPAALVVVALLTVSPWTIRNAVELDAFVPVSTQLGSALAGTYNDEARNDRENPASWRNLKRVPGYQHLYDQAGSIPEASLERTLRERAFRYIADHPLYVAEVAFWTTRRMLDLAGIDWARHTASTISVERSWADAGIICFWIFAPLALGGAFTRRARQAPAYFWAFPVLMYLSVVFLVVETPRYRSAIDPFIVLLAALAVTELLSRARRHS